MRITLKRVISLCMVAALVFCGIPGNGRPVLAQFEDGLLLPNPLDDAEDGTEQAKEDTAKEDIAEEDTAEDITKDESAMTETDEETAEAEETSEEPEAEVFASASAFMAAAAALGGAPHTMTAAELSAWTGKKISSDSNGFVVATGETLTLAADDTIGATDRLKVEPNLAANNNWQGVRLAVGPGFGWDTDWDMVQFDMIYRSTNGRAYFVELRDADVIWDVANVTWNNGVNNGIENLPTGYRMATVKLFIPKGTDVSALAIDIYPTKNQAYAESFYIGNVICKVAAATGDRPTNATQLPITGHVVGTWNPATETVVGTVVGGIRTPSSIKLADGAATTETKELFSYLQGVANSSYLLFGQENANFNKNGLTTWRGASTSDVRDVAEDWPAIYGVDTLSFLGMEGGYAGSGLSNGSGLRALVSGTAKNSIKAYQQGMLVTLSSHMSNPAVIYDLDAAGTAKKGGDYGWNFKGHGYDGTGGSKDLTADPMNRILLDAGVRGVYNAYLDMIANYCLELQASNVPVLLRLLHENSGGWFWWGTSTSSPDTFKNVWRYSVEYLRDVKGVHNALYVYSPNGLFSDEAAYADRWPGNAWVDVAAFDQYGQGVEWAKGPLTNTLKVVSDFAKKNGKVAAISEAGINAGTITTHAEYFNYMLDAATADDINMAYLMTWTYTVNNQGYVPQKTTYRRGNAPAANAFIRFANDGRSVLMSGINLAGTVQGKPITNEAVAATTGYILSPVGGAYLADAITATAKVTGTSAGTVKMRLVSADGTAYTEVAATKNAGTGYYEAVFSKKAVYAYAEGLSGTIELWAGDVLLGKNDIKFGVAPIKPAYAVDDFEMYNGSHDALKQAWSLMGSGTPNIWIDDYHKSSGDYGMGYQFTFPGTGNEEWVGASVNYTGDWSAFNALQFYLRPSGKGQKVTIQLQVSGPNATCEFTLPDFDKTETAKIVTIPFDSFVPQGQANGSATHPLAGRTAIKVAGFGLYCNSIGNTSEISGTLYYDNIRAVKVDDVGALKLTAEAGSLQPGAQFDNVGGAIPGEPIIYEWRFEGSDENWKAADSSTTAAYGISELTQGALKIALNKGNAAVLKNFGSPLDLSGLNNLKLNVFYKPGANSNPVGGDTGLRISFSPRDPDGSYSYVLDARGRTARTVTVPVGVPYEDTGYYVSTVTILFNDIEPIGGIKLGVLTTTYSGLVYLDDIALTAGAKPDPNEPPDPTPTPAPTPAPTLAPTTGGGGYGGGGTLTLTPVGKGNGDSAANTTTGGTATAAPSATTAPPPVLKEIPPEELAAVEGKVTASLSKVTGATEAGKPVSVTNVTRPAAIVVEAAKAAADNTPIDTNKTYALLQEDGTLVPVPTYVDPVTGAATVLATANGTYVAVDVESSFTDVKPTDWYAGAILDAAHAMIIQGDGNGPYRPNDTVTVAEVAKMFENAIGLAAAKTPEGGKWYEGTMAAALKAGIVASSANPEGKETRLAAAEMAAAALKAAGLNTYLSADDRAKARETFKDIADLTREQQDAFALCLKLNIFVGYGDGTVRPLNTLTRAEMAVVTMKLRAAVVNGVLKK